MVTMVLILMEKRGKTSMKWHKMEKPIYLYGVNGKTFMDDFKWPCLPESFFLKVTTVGSFNWVSPRDLLSHGDSPTWIASNGKSS